MARVWRDGQHQRTYVYRLLAAGSIEEKIYQHQVTKQGLSGVVVDARGRPSDAGSTAVPTFDYEQLRALFSLDEETLCATYDLLGCDCDDEEGQRVAAERRKQREDARESVRDCQLGVHCAGSKSVRNPAFVDVVVLLIHLSTSCKFEYWYLLIKII